MSDPETLARFVVLETKIAYQERTIAELNDVVVEQAQAMTDMQRRLKMMESQLDAAAGPQDLPHEKPPHY